MQINIKMQAVQERENMNSLQKKIVCPNHQMKYLFRCEYSGCQFPFICGSTGCIEKHFHEERIIMSKFSLGEITEKFNEVESLMDDGAMDENARTIKNHIEELKQAIKNVYVNIKSLKQNYDCIKGDKEGYITSSFIDRVEQNYTLSRSVRSSIEELKSKVKIDFPLKDSYFSMRASLGEFLEENIHGFSWSKCRQIYSSKNQLITCEKFHDKLLGLTNLIFVFIGDDVAVGSYYSSAYPSMQVKLRKDMNSFLFGSWKKPAKFIRYWACDHADSHLMVGEKNYICQGNTQSYGDGIRTFHKNFQTLEYCLPTHTYTNADYPSTMNGTLHIKKFLILQLPPNDAIKPYPDD